MSNFSQISHTFLSVQPALLVLNGELKAIVFETAQPCTEFLTSSSPFAFPACPSAPNSKSVFISWKLAYPKKWMSLFTEFGATGSQ